MPYSTKIIQMGMNGQTIYIIFQYNAKVYLLEEDEKQTIIKNYESQEIERELFNHEFIERLFTIAEEKTN